MRTDNQREADRFEVRLTALIEKARDIQTDMIPLSKSDSVGWGLVAAYLDAARRNVVAMMADDPSDNVIQIGEKR